MDRSVVWKGLLQFVHIATIVASFLQMGHKILLSTWDMPKSIPHEMQFALSNISFMTTSPILQSKPLYLGT
jgi:hypothetical protein